MYLAQSTNWGHYRIGIWKCWFLRRGENRNNRRKTTRSKDENQQQTQPTYDAESGNRTRATLVGGECSHYCAIPAPPDTSSKIPSFNQRCPIQSRLQYVLGVRSFYVERNKEERETESFSSFSSCLSSFNSNKPLENDIFFSE